MILSGKARLAGILGWPVGHSRSPRLHGYWLRRYGIDGAYVPLPVMPENLESAVRALPMLGFRGANVTVPHKEAVLPLVDVLDETAARIGAVNTLFVDDDLRVHGTNTDAFGFLAHLRESMPTWRPHDGPAVVLGAGGASRGVVCALKDAGVPEIRIANRTRGRAERLSDEFGRPVEAVDWPVAPAVLGDAALLVNATSLGMRGQPPLEIGLDGLPETAAVYDIVYSPLDTPLLIEARRRGNPTVDGLGMLLHQARPGFHAWFGVDPQVDEGLRAFVLESLVAEEAR